MGSTMLERYLQGLSNPRPGFGIAVPGNEIPGWFNHRSKGSSISVQVPSGRMGFFACVAFNANDESPSLFCHFKANGRENYPSPMCINFEGHLFSDHIWLFYLSFDYLKELQEWQHESFSNIELSFHSYEQGVKVNNCGVCLLSSLYIIVTGEEATSSYKDSLAFSSSCHEWMANVFPVTYLNSDLALGFIIPIEKEPEKVMAIRSKLFEAIEESGMPIIIFSRDCASLPWCHDELVRIAGFMDEIKSDTVFPVSHYVDQSKMDDQTESYTIVFYKNEENLRENEEKGQRWKDILTKVEISSGSKSGRRAPATQLQQIQLHLHQQRIQHLQLVKMWQGWLQKREHMSEQQCEEHLELQEQLLEWRRQQQQQQLEWRRELKWRRQLERRRPQLQLERRGWRSGGGSGSWSSRTSSCCSSSGSSSTSSSRTSSCCSSSGSGSSCCSSSSSSCLGFGLESNLL